MYSRRTIFGSVASVIWLVAIVYLASANIRALSALKPNEWGDFLAGAFAPLAFLWLVLGYLQQGDELRLSTDALRLQAKELQSSTEQQRALVEISRQQVESEREALIFERKLREDLSLPKFSVLGAGGSFRGDGRSTYGFTIKNAGHDATDFSAKLKFLGGDWREVMSHPLFGKGATFSAEASHPTPLPEGDSVLVLSYIDGLGRTAEKTYRIGKQSEERQAGLTFRAEA